MARKNRVEFHNATRLQPFVMIDLHCNGKDIKTGRISQRDRSMFRVTKIRKQWQRYKKPAAFHNVAGLFFMKKLLRK